MVTITEDYVSFEIAKLLKEKGFKGNCIMDYIDNELINVYDYDYPSMYELENTEDDVINAPTLQMAMKWLRIEHNIHIEPHIVKTKYSYGYMPNYIDLKELKQHFPFYEFDFSNADKYACITYDKACEATILYCLESLI